jgi:hypothetical protein
VKRTRNRTRLFFGLTLVCSISLLILASTVPAITAAGTGIFTPHLTTPSFGAGVSTDVSLGDLDGDLDLDAVVANASV